ncbi:TolC family protein [Candidatus Laterigemmans baculatus]|uniref:hypothetical protein n=1 Tax=Candidatus Laterigemmans baculatus TaxID=2770505 RepID=UPI0013D9B1D9|nr:hypothetical protein [Candidatus Laterigemmans baculatus]
MSHAAALLLAIFAASPSTAGEATVAEHWSADQVGQMASAHAPAARVFESERRAIACGIDRDDPAVCAQVALVQSIYASLAAHERNNAAAEALTAYWQIVAVNRQLQTLDQAAPLLDSLEELAETAERLELPSGVREGARGEDRDGLAERRLELEDRWFEADFARQRLRNQLAALLGTSPTRARTATLSDPLSDFLPAADETSPWDVEREIAVALANRSDLEALETLCRCTTAESLPAARELLGTLSPGVGLALAAAPSGGRLLAVLHAPRPSPADLACRRTQCRELVERRREQIRFEVRDAVLEIEAATARADVARRRLALAQEAASRAARATELDQQPPGSETTAELKVLERRGELVEKQLAIAEARVQLRKVQGIAASSAASSAATR